MWIWVILGIILIIIILIISLYNNLVKASQKVKNAWAQIDTQLKRRFDLIPNLIETVKKYMEHEEKTLTEISKAKNMFNEALKVDEKANANDMLTNGLKNIFALAEAYPELKANQNFALLQEELSKTEDKIAFSRQFYNDTVQMYNTLVMTFPTNLFAKIFGFKEEKFFEIENKSEKENVKVKF
jgi:lemA protein